MSLSANAAIGRPRLFDEEAVLAKLTALFWRQGYSQTSMTEIVKISGVHKPSLYRTFGTKEELFAIVLRRYLAERIGMFTALIEQAGPGIGGVHRFLELFEGDAISERGRDGCLMVMASNELRGSLAGYDFSADYRRQMGEQIRILLARALPEAVPELIQARTDLLVTYLLGLQVVLRSGADAEEIHRYFHAVHVTADTW
ncbi:TetR/AcrR family transcriptional regulator [Paenarthrobacter sp. Z7-10]|uniref:TetR/AcrR family transcriptional regulator n=1 Tax=Paenarthrobacter sp. Z7-10 TaxID=2787635 RepID=UPI0022A8DD9C|nr:TetR/AcrR family transcriptional regulator [Paenarthrobacter sp. Z7-10]MCZ2404245.1 TetR/AcrR family transcriptional regulator [Paenarthrobacter sp. Z7-10]